MTCEAFVELASDSLDDQLDAGEQAMLRAHLELCADCSSRYDELRALGSLLAAVGPVEPPADRGAALLDAVERDRRSLGGTWKRLLGYLTPVGGLVPSTTVAAAILLLVIGLSWPDARPLDPPRPRVPHGVARAIPNDTLLTVWDSSADIIVASAAPVSALAPPIDLDELELLSASVSESVGRTAPAVRMFLYERIVVIG